MSLISCIPGERNQLALAASCVGILAFWVARIYTGALVSSKNKSSTCDPWGFPVHDEWRLGGTGEDGREIKPQPQHYLSFICSPTFPMCAIHECWAYIGSRLVFILDWLGLTHKSDWLTSGCDRKMCPHPTLSLFKLKSWISKNQNLSMKSFILARRVTVTRSPSGVCHRWTEESPVLGFPQESATGELKSPRYTESLRSV